MIKKLVRIALDAKDAFAIRHVTVLGDSHARVFITPWLRLRFPLTAFHVTAVGGATAHGLNNPNSKSQARQKFQAALDKHRKGAPIITLLGEIDTGFLSWIKGQKTGQPVSEYIDQALQTYKAFLVSTKQYGPITAISCPLPTIRTGEQFGEVATERIEVTATQEQRTTAAKSFNQKLEIITREIGAHFVDLDPISVGANGLVKNSLLHRNKSDHHYDSKAYSKMLATHLDKLPSRL